MGYMHINNLYRDQTILAFKEVFALEKIHGTSAWLSWNNGKVGYFSGGEKHDNFVKVFDEAGLIHNFTNIGMEKVMIFGEAYGGKCQGMKNTYGDKLKFVVFDVKIGEHWLDVPNAHDVANKLGLEFVDYVKIPATLEFIDAERDKPSTQAIRNGCGNDKLREGVVLRPPFEVRDNSGERIMAKHKREEFRETRTPRKVADSEKNKVLENAKAAALEYVTDMRLSHVLDKIPEEGRVINNMKNIF
jgi:hypothetical protein